MTGKHAIPMDGIRASIDKASANQPKRPAKHRADINPEIADDSLSATFEPRPATSHVRLGAGAKR